MRTFLLPLLFLVYLSKPYALAAVCGTRDTLISPSTPGNDTLLLKSIWKSEQWGKTWQYCDLKWILTQWTWFRNIHLPNITRTIESGAASVDKHRDIYDAMHRFLKPYTNYTFFWCIPIDGWGLMGDYLNCQDQGNRVCDCPETRTTTAKPTTLAPTTLAPTTILTTPKPACSSCASGTIEFFSSSTISGQKNVPSGTCSTCTPSGSVDCWTPTSYVKFDDVPYEDRAWNGAACSQGSTCVVLADGRTCSLTHPDVTIQILRNCYPGYGCHMLVALDCLTCEDFDFGLVCNDQSKFLFNDMLTDDQMGFRELIPNSPWPVATSISCGSCVKQSDITCS